MLKALQDKIHDIDALLITSPANRRYALDFASSAGCVLVTRDAGYFLVDFRYITAARERVRGYAIEMVTAEKKYADWLTELLAAHGVKTLGFEQDAMTFSEHAKYADAPGVTLVPSGEVLSELRQSKQPFEIERMVRAQRVAESALDVVLPLIRPGVSERELAAELIYRMLRGGAEDVSFPPIVVSGPNSALPHGVPGDRAFASGDVITMDFGCKVDGYCSDMTRTVVLGRASDEVKTVYGTVLRAQLAGIDAACAGVTGRAVDEAARAVIRDAGYGDCFGHGFGHGLGLEVHEAPNASVRNDKPLPDGAVISAEPGIYLPGKFGVRIEDVLHLTGGGCVNLTAAPKELLEL